MGDLVSDRPRPPVEHGMIGPSHGGRKRPITNTTPPRGPNLIFFCELGPHALTELFARPEVLPTLVSHGYGVALAMSDWSEERAFTVRLLNVHHVPVVGWLLLPATAGYWFNLQNYPHALAAYSEFRKWLQQYELQLDGVGLDMEPSLADVQSVRHTRRALFSRLWRSQRNALFPAAQSAYTDLVANIRHDGYTVYAYQIPLIVDDRRAGTTLVQRIFDVVDLPVDEEVLMCYSSILPRDLFGNDLNGAFVRSYAVHANGLAIGSTGGGVVLDPVTGAQAHQLTWAAFVRDLQIAVRYTPTVHIFSLEGCVEQGWLTRIADIDWTAPLAIPIRDRLVVGGARSLLALWLWASHSGWSILGWLGWIVAGWLFLVHQRPRWLRRAR